jgi:hypothetical protein
MEIQKQNLEDKTEKKVPFLKKVSGKLLPWAVGLSGPLLFLSTIGLINDYEKKDPSLFEHPPEIRAYIGARESGNYQRANFCMKNFDSVRRYEDDTMAMGFFSITLTGIYALMGSGPLGAAIYIDRKERERRYKLVNRMKGGKK